MCERESKVRLGLSLYVRNLRQPFSERQFTYTAEHTTVYHRTIKLQDMGPKWSQDWAISTAIVDEVSWPD